MKVAFITTVYAPHEIGGAERTVRTLATALARHGHEVVVISLHPKRLRSVGLVDGVRVYYLPLWNIYWPHGGPKRALWKRLAWHVIDSFNPLMALEVWRILRKERPDLVQTGNLQGFSVACWAVARWLDVPLVQMLHDYYLACPNASMFRAGENCTSQCSSCHLLSAPRRALSGTPHAVISLSQRALGRIESCGMFEQVKRKEILHGACDLRPQPGERVNKAPKQPLVLGYLGRIEQIKGIETLLDALAQLPSDQVSLIIAGSGAPPYVAELRSRHRLGNVAFMGFMAPAEFFSRIDALVVPSIWEEPLGRVIYEAYHYGVPAIVARSGGMPEIVDEGATGFVFRARDAAHLTEILAVQIDRGWPAARFREACLAKSKEFGIDTLYHRYFDVWEGAARTRRRLRVSNTATESQARADGSARRGPPPQLVP
jgi:glycosyltransferase involved in cell wall biosynthesis